jgi:hypothetical protein
MLQLPPSKQKEQFSSLIGAQLASRLVLTNPLLSFQEVT